jgi:hypothetical protein
MNSVHLQFGQSQPVGGRIDRALWRTRSATSNDQSQLAPLLNVIKTNLGRNSDEASVDAG